MISYSSMVVLGLSGTYDHGVTNHTEMTQNSRHETNALEYILCVYRVYIYTRKLNHIRKSTLYPRRNMKNENRQKDPRAKYELSFCFIASRPQRQLPVCHDKLMGVFGNTTTYTMRTPPCQQCTYLLCKLATLSDKGSRNRPWKQGPKKGYHMIAQTLSQRG